METMVRMGELAISDTPGDVLVSLGLGSCIGLAVVDKRAGVAGLAHIVLPATTGTPKPEAMNKFADHAVPALVDGMVERGASRMFLQASLVGGASMFAGAASKTLEVGAHFCGPCKRGLANDHSQSRICLASTLDRDNRRERPRRLGGREAHGEYP